MQDTPNNDYPKERSVASPVQDFGTPFIDDCNVSELMSRTPGQTLQRIQVIVPRTNRTQVLAQAQPLTYSRVDSQTGNNINSSSHVGHDSSSSETVRLESDYAFGLEKEVSGSKYGSVFGGYILKRNMKGSTEKWIKTDKKCAVKKYNFERLNSGRRNGSAEKPINEFATMQHLLRFYMNSAQGGEQETYPQVVEVIMNRTNIIMPLGVFRDSSTKDLYCVMPYVDGCELIDVIKQDRISEAEARHWMAQILNAVEKLQTAHVTHRDISLENIMTNKEGEAFIIDMGMSIKIPYLQEVEGDDEVEQRCLIGPDQFCGKRFYMSPEIFNGEEPFDGHAVDVWALGPTLFALVTGCYPWQRPAEDDPCFQKFSIKGEFNEKTVSELQLDFSTELTNLLHRMFLIDPRQRLSLEQIRNHPWMQGEALAPEP
jgi:serine/threonine protein kinase